MTEDEAKTKWCPSARSLPEGSEGSGNRWPKNDDDTPNEFADHNACIGSACMAWRWSGAFPLPDDPPAISERYNGYCGLAGKP